MEEQHEMRRDYFDGWENRTLAAKHMKSVVTKFNFVKYKLVLFYF